MRGRKQGRRFPPAYKSSNLTVSRAAPAYTTRSQAEDFRTYVLYSILGVGAAAGLTFLGVTLVKKTREKTLRTNAERNSLDPGEADNLAKRLKMAFDNDTWGGWGTDEERVYQVYREIPDRNFYRIVQREYASMYNTELNSDLE